MSNIFRAENWFWIVAGDETRVYASARRAYVPIEDSIYAAWIKSDNAATRISSEAELFDMLRAANVPPFHSVPTYRILRRIEDLGKADAAETALNANRTLFRRFYTIGTIPADDENARTFLAAIGVDPDVVLAPE